MIRLWDCHLVKLYISLATLYIDLHVVMSKHFQVTLALLKPDIAGNPRLVQSIEKFALSKKFYIVKRKQLRWNKQTAKEFYLQHKGRFFYDRLVSFMSSGPIVGLILAKEDAISDWRSLMGPTKVYQAQYAHPRTIRGQIGLTDTRNTAHGSDSASAVREELAHVFPEFILANWQKNEGRLFKNGLISFDRKLRIHKPIYDHDIDTPINKLFGTYSHKDIRLFDMGSPDDWTKYYRKVPEPLDWFADYDQLKNYLDDLLAANSSFKTVVDVGCGSSCLGPKLANARPDFSVYCIDISIECLQTLAINCDRANCTFAIGDARSNLPFDDHSVDLIIDKGTSDALCRSKGGASNFEMMMNEAKRVLQKKGILLQITTDPPEQKLLQINNYDEHTRVSFNKLPIISNQLPIYAYKVHFFPPAKDGGSKTPGISSGRESTREY